MLYQFQDEIDDDGMPEGDVTGCDDDDWEDDGFEVDASDPLDIEYDR